MRPLLLALALAPLAVPAAAQAPAGNAGPRAAAQAFAEAEQRGDLAALDRLLAPDFLFVRGTGQVGDRRDFLAGFGHGTALRLEPAGEPLFVRVGSDSAVVGGAARATVTEGGRTFRQGIRFTDVLALRGGRWQLVYLHLAPLP